MHEMLATLRSIIVSKSSSTVLATFGFFAAVALARFYGSFSLPALLFLMGALVGMYLLAIAETFFRLQPSPFRSVLFTIVSFPVTVFLITSSGSFFASGVMLSLYASLVFLMVEEWRGGVSHDSWYRFFQSVPTKKMQYRIFLLHILSLLFLGGLFALS